MKALVILAHPDEKSFNHAIARQVTERLEANGYEVVFHDLYAERFDPVLTSAEIPKNAALPDTISGHSNDLSSADGIVIIHPNWWGQPPAILKGWVDRIVRPGIAYRFIDGDNGEGIPEGLLIARSALVINTSNTPIEREQQEFGDPLETLWKSCVFGLCGVKKFHRRMFNIVIMSDEAQRKLWLAEVKEMVDRLFPPMDI